MKILYINTGMHIKNDFALKNYKNISLHTYYSTDILDNINLEEFGCVLSPAHPIDVSKYPNTNFIFGPQFSVFPDDRLQLIKSKNSVYNLLSDWVVNCWSKYTLCDELNLVKIPFGVDTVRFKEIKPFHEKSQIFIYYKRRNPSELQYVLNFFQNKNIEVKMFDYVNRYSEEEYLSYLQNSKYGIWLDAHESQGFALQEALSCGVPLLIWNVKYMNQEFGSNYDNIPTTTIPYWDERCGEYFYDKDDLEKTYNLFISKLETYKPRDFILENLSMEVCEKKLINIINNMKL